MAIAGVLLTMFQAWRTQVHNKRSVRPFLQLGYGLPQGGTGALTLSNIGLGPAILIRTQLFLDDKPFGGLDQPSINRLRDTLKTRPKATTLAPGYAIAKDASAALLSMPDYDKVRNAEFGDLIATRLGIEIVYTSFYGEKFTLTWHRSEGKPHDRSARTSSPEGAE